MANFPYVLLLALFLAVLPYAAGLYPLWNDECTYTLDAWNHANATGTYPIQGISATQSHIANATFNWTIYDTVTRFGYGPSNFQNNQFFWLDSSKTSQAASEPLKGCVYGLQGLPSSLVKKGQDDTGDCTSILDADCINDLKTQFGGLSDGTVVDGQICQPPLSMSLPNCKKYAPKGSTDGSFWAVTVSSDVQIGPRPRVASCSAVQDLPLPLVATGTGSIYGDSSADNFTYYDMEVTNVTPLIMSFFNDPNTTANSFQQTSMYCLRPKNVTAGSRVPTAVAGAGSRLELSATLLGITLAAMLYGL